MDAADSDSNAVEAVEDFVVVFMLDLDEDAKDEDVVEVVVVLDVVAVDGRLVTIDTESRVNITSVSSEQVHPEYP